MLFLLDVRFEDPGYNAYIHFVTTINVGNHEEAKHFVYELTEALKRRNVWIIHSSYYRFDHDQILQQRAQDYHGFSQRIATASMQVEQFIMNDPNQEKSLWDNLLEDLLNGKKSIALEGNKYNIPVKVMDKDTREPITSEAYLFSIEHLIPKN